MDLTQITDHTARALSRVVTQFRGSEFEGLVRAFAAEIQVAEDALFSLVFAIRSPDLASGTTLDKLGALVGAEPRASLSDVAYRVRVQAAILRNRSWSLPEELIAIVKLFMPNTLVFRDALVEGVGCAIIAPASFDASQYGGTTVSVAEEIMRYLPRAAATRVILSYSPNPYDGSDTLALFDTGANGFDTSPGGSTGFSGSVDQNTRNT